jgi:hypothetical protein
VAFYDHHVQTAFANRQAIIYGLPDEKSVQAVFGRYGAGSPTACDNHPPTSKLKGAYKNAK